MSVDSINTFPEDGVAGAKFVMGDAVLQVIMPDGSFETVGSFKYDQQTYELTSGFGRY